MTESLCVASILSNPCVKTLFWVIIADYFQQSKSGENLFVLTPVSQPPLMQVK